MSGKIRSRSSPIVIGGVGIATALLSWEIVSRVIANDTFPPATATVFRLASLTGDSNFLSDLGQTLSHWGLGLLVSIALAVPAALLIARSPFLDRSTAGSIDFMRSVPPIVILPMVLVIAGTGQFGVLVLVVFGAIWPMLLSSIAGVRSIDPLLFDTAEAFRFKRWRVIWSITAPAALPQVLAGVRVAAGIALVVAVVTEFVGSVQGLGQYIVIAQLSSNFVGMYAAILAVGIVGLLTNGLISAMIAQAMRPYGPATGGAK